MTRLKNKVISASNKILIDKLPDFKLILMTVPAETSVQTPYQSQRSIIPPTPDTANVMLLLQKAMKQLNEVKIDLTTPPRYVTSPQVTHHIYIIYSTDSLHVYLQRHNECESF